MKTTGSTVLDLSLDPALAGTVKLGLVWGLGLPGCPTTEACPPWLAAILQDVRAAGESYLGPERKASVRAMLRHGKYKPSGRSKPSSEYLVAVALEPGEGVEGGFPLVNGPVDVNNGLSLQWGYPASIFDLAKTGPSFLVRLGHPGESYVFNPSGQVIDLEDLLLVGRKDSSGQWEACGNPVKDAMATKVFEDARDVAAIVYAPGSEPRAHLEGCCVRFAALLAEACGAVETGYSILD